MTQRILIVGAGIIGASAAYHLQKSGAQVTVLDAGGPSATAASFGWINASFYKDVHHFQLRAGSLSSYRALCKTLDLPVHWCGALSWEVEGDALEAQRDELEALGYDVRELDAEAFARLEPHVSTPPERCLQFQSEAAAESRLLAETLMEAAIAAGAQCLRGMRVTRLIEQGGYVTGVQTEAGALHADHTLVAAGTASQELLATINAVLPMVPRPALMVQTKPVPPVLSHILVSELGELRQLPNGALMIPAAVAHQADAAEHLPADINEAASATVARLQNLMPNVPLSLGQAMIGHRPMPEDGLPVMGRIAPGAYVAVMHSGITLGAIAGDLIAKDMLEGLAENEADLLTPYRPSRFIA
ncbi:MAG: FAD-dependent oxidoreductase [Pseudomonadota bacterium]